MRCELCPHRCRIPEGKHGFCLTRENIGGRLAAANYCRPVSTAVDPIEKKPLFHFHPGSSIFSTGPNGCTFKCSFCQNSEISQGKTATREMTPEEIAGMAAKHGSIGIAYTYSEPIIWFETIMEVGAKIKERGLKNVMVTNGFIEPAPLNDLLSIVDAMNIDIKSMNPSFYRRICKGSLEPVLKTCETVKKAGCHLEITNLLIPGENDGPEETAALADFMAIHLGKDTPLHISRYFPRYKMDHSPTPPSALERAWEIARKKLDYVYVGNIASGDRENTFCPQCGELLIARSGYSVRVDQNLEVSPGKHQKCGNCNTLILLIL
ncbi:MAG: AmmeMemoRadiSam system radical SAM enzyme [Chitinispirillaceae bacterium]|nr:AmmeMemoRadiSam system radical SAM enzyme [Chitinispirillaceae bacterium]